MRFTRICFVAGLLLTLSIAGSAQQPPDGAQVPGPPSVEIAKLRTLMKAQTEAIQTLQSRIVELETRVEKLEKVKPATGDK